MKTPARLAAILLPLGLSFPQSADDSKLKYEYLNLPAALQAKCALYQLDRRIEQIQSGGSAETLKGLEDGRRWLKTAIEYFGKFDETEAGYAGKGDPAKSPLGLMQHAWLAEFGMIQSEAAWMREARPPTLSAQQIEALNAAGRRAVEAVKTAVRELENAQGWVEHSDGMFLSLRVPPGFRPGRSPDYRLYLFWRLPQSTMIEKEVLVSVKSNPKNIQDYDYQKEALARERGAHPELVVREEDRFFPGIRGRWFTYDFSWKEKKIVVLLYHFVDSGFVWEIKYMAFAQRFDEEEAEGVIRSMQVK